MCSESHDYLKCRRDNLTKQIEELKKEMKENIKNYLMIMKIFKKKCLQLKLK